MVKAHECFGGQRGVDGEQMLCERVVQISRERKASE